MGRYYLWVFSHCNGYELRRVMGIHAKSIRRASVAVAIVLLGLSVSVAGQVKTDAGSVEGSPSADGKVQIFKGIPYAAPPIGALRWKEPQPVASWKGVRKATEYGARCMQGNVFGDMVFRDAGPSEDCLYLNVWTPNTSADAKLPVMVWIYGGGFQAGATSEPRQDGEALAHRGVVIVSMNYRLGIFGFFSHPELTKESDRHASGNYAFMDQVAALQWVQKNIAAFGGDPRCVTVFGDSAGAASLSNLMGSPQARGMFQRAIAESGAWIGLSVNPMRKLADAEQAGLKTAESLGAKTLAELRAKTADDLMKAGRGGGPVIDGWFLPQDVGETFAEGKQNDVPI